MKENQVESRKRISLTFLNEELNDIKTIKSEDSNVLIYGITGTVKDEIKQQEGRFLPALLVPFDCFHSATSDFFSSKTYKWKKS